LRNGSQDLARRRLLLEGRGHLSMRLRKRLILLLQFGEQADIRDGDDRLVGKCFQQRDLLLGKRTGRRPSLNRNRPDRDRDPITNHGHRKHAAEADRISQRV
jgi:hypothetical protein